SLLPNPYFHYFPTRRSSDLLFCDCRSARYAQNLPNLARIPPRNEAKPGGGSLGLSRIHHSRKPSLDQADACVSCHFRHRLERHRDRKSTRLNSSHGSISYAV